MARYVESTLEFTVVRCQECPGWYAYADDKLDGWRVARAHEMQTHRGEKQALRAGNAARWRARKL